MQDVSRRTRTTLAVLLVALLAACAGARAPEPEAVAAAPLALEAKSAVNAAAESTPAAPLEDARAAIPAEPAAGDVASDLPRAKSEVARVVPAALETRAVPVARAARESGSELGYLLVDLESGLPLAAHNPDRPLIPASTIKLATAIVALDLLGPHHRYRTELLATGPIRDGELAGDLILRGTGDPALDVADLLGLAVRLRLVGIHTIAGDFLIDDLALPRLTEIDPEQPAEAAYNAGIGALSLAFNRARVAWRGGGEPMSLPPLAEARFEPTPRAALPAGGVELGHAGAEDVVWRIAAGQRRDLWLPVKDPGLHAGHVFRELARAQGVRLAPPVRGAAPIDARQLAVHQSPPLRTLVQDMLLYSNNVVAELIGLSAVARLQGPDSWRDPGARMLAHLARLMPEVDWRGAALGNFSGLDSAARLTPQQLAALLRHGWRSEALPALLAAGGWSGTLSRRFDDDGSALRVWAKTGTLNYGSALAGYLYPGDGPPMAFVAMVSDIGARAAYDVLERPDRAAEAAAGRWNARVRALQDELVESWLEPLPTS